MGLRSRGLFRAVTSLLALVFGLLSLGLLDLVSGLLPTGSVSAREASNVLSDTAYGVIAVALVAGGFLGQAWRPERAFSPFLQVGLVAVALALAAVWTGALEGVPGAGAVLVAVGLVGLVAPERRRLFRARPRPSQPLVVLALVALGPTSVYVWHAAESGRAHLPPTNDFAFVPSFWSAVTAMATATVLVALLSALRCPGWRASALCVSVAGLVFASACLVHPDVAASVGRGWSVAVVLWTLAWTGSTLKDRSGLS